MTGPKYRFLAAALAPWLLLSACASAPSSARKTENRQAEQYYQLGQASFSEGKNQEAIENLKKSLRLNPKNADAHSFLGVIYLLLSDFSNSEKELEEALKLNPYLTDAKNSLGAVYMNTGRGDKAKALFEEALKDKTYPTPERILYNLGTVELDARRYPEALDAFRRSVSANDKYAKGYLGLGQVLLATGKTEEAKANFQKVIALDPKSPEAARAQEFLAGRGVPGKV